MASLADEAGRLGWTAVETAGLLAAAEERCALWILTGRRLHREPRVCRWRNGRLTDAEGGVEALAAAAAGAPARTSVCLAAVSGRRRPPRSIISTLARSGARIGRVTGGVADELEVTWAVEVLIAPALAPRGMAGLRERIAAAPRCAWCRIPVLGSSCPRCREAAT
ncbi:MAG: hypothetical protein ACTHNU_15340 [Gaiellales bacterium]